MVVSFAALQLRKLVHDSGRCGMIGAVGRLDYRQGPLELGFGAVEALQVPQHAAEVDPYGGDAGVVGAKGGLTDGQGPLVLGLGAVEVPLV